MDVTRKNQEAAYQDLVALLPHCEFYALDLEMTGIRAPAKLLQRRELAVAAAKGQSVYPTVMNYDDGQGVNNKTKVGQCPLLAHPQLQPPRESYDEKIVAASTFNVVQLGLSLFFKKDTKILAPRGVDVLGNAPLPVSDSPSPSASPSAEALLEKEKGAATVKRSSKLHSNNRAIPDVTLPLTAEGKALWLDVDKDLASLSSTESSSTTTTFVSVDAASAAVGSGDVASDPSALVAAALTRITDFIAKTCDEIKSVVDGTTHDEGAPKTFLTGDEVTLSGFASMEDVSAVKTKLSVLDHHTRLFNSLTDAVQLKGLVEQFAVVNGYGGGSATSLSSASSSQLVSFASGASPILSSSSAGSPKSISKSELSSTSGTPATAVISRQKWLSFDELFTFITLESGRLVEVPAAKGSGGGNAFGASKKGGGSNENAASSPTPSSSVAASPSPSSAAATVAVEEYTIRAFSFYLFPHPSLDARDMTMNSTTVGDFLATQSPISFDKWVKLGVHYISREKLLLLRNRNAVEGYAAKDLVKVSKKNNSEGSPMAQLKASCPSLTFEEIGTLSTFLEKCRKYAASVAVAKASEGAKIPDPMPFPFQKPEAFSVTRKLLSELGLEKNGKFIVPTARGPATPKDKDVNKKTTDGGTDGPLSSTEASPRAPYTAQNKLFAKWQEKSHAAASAGTRVFEALVNCKKPIIVQNGWSDLAFLYTAFHGCTPLDLPAFKVAINALFPTVYDSRTLATLEQFNSFSNRGRLERMYLSFQQEYGKSVNIFVPEFGQELFAPDEKTGAAAAHDASYDSFITGSLFLYERAALRDAARYTTNSSSGTSNNNNYSPKSYVSDVYKFANIVPCYGSVFSIKLDDENTDVWLTASPSTPIIRVTFANESDYKKAPRALYSGQTKIKSHFSKQSLPGVVQVPKDNELFYFVDSNAKGLGGALLDFGLQQATPGIMKDVGYSVKLEVMPMKEVFDLAGMSVKPFWPSQ